MIIDNKTILKIIIFVLLLSICFYIIGEAYADETIVNITNNEEKPNITVYNGNDSFVCMEKKNNSYIQIQKSDKLYTDTPTITITSKPSCGCRYSYKYWYTRTYVNYCPNCHRYNSLLKNPKGVREKELTCKYCSSDYCGTCGKEKYSWSRVYLRKA